MGSQAWMDGRLRTIAHRAIAEPGLKLPLTGKALPDNAMRCRKQRACVRLKCCKTAPDLVKE
jgi:hypothetical protein